MISLKLTLPAVTATALKRESMHTRVVKQAGPYGGIVGASGSGYAIRMRMSPSSTRWFA
jgi:hypothetical protein